MVRYNNDYLQQFCKDNNLVLRKDYSQEKVTWQTRIIAKCLECDDDMIGKRFQSLVENQNFRCKKCQKGVSLAKRMNTRKARTYATEVFTNDYLLQFCEENHITLRKDYSQEKVKGKTRIIAKCIEADCDNNMTDKSFQILTIHKNFRCEECQKDVTKEKRKNTNIELFGVDNVMFNEDIKAKLRVTNLGIYGFEYASQNEDVKQKSKNTNLERHGCEYPAQNEEVKQKIKNTQLERYGGHPLQNEEVRNKLYATNLKRYGFIHAMQNPEILDKQAKSAHRSKDYVLPSGKTIKLQGYESFALDILLQVENLHEDDIFTGRSEVPIIWYKDINGKKHRYFMDIYIPSQNRGIEVKSIWTYYQHQDGNKAKWIESSKICKEFDIYIFDEKANIVCIRKVIDGVITEVIPSTSSKLLITSGEFY